MSISRRFLVCLLLLSACEDPASNGHPSDEEEPDDPSDAGMMGVDAAGPEHPSDAAMMPLDTGVPSELDCPGVFDCFTVCADGDDPCLEACVARGSAAEIILVNDVLVCADTNGCLDEDCLATNCSPELLACAGTPVIDSGAGCDGAGKPELTGPITGLEPAYLAGDPIDIGVPVDEDTARVIVGVYEVGSELYLGGTAEDVAGLSTATLSLFAGVANGATGTFYLSVELCSTSVCTTPFVRNTYQRADRTASPLSVGETYEQTRENVGGPTLVERCGTAIPIQSFLIE